jgi:hypothetical protein
MVRRHRLLLALLLLPMLGGGLAGLRWMHETFAHGLDGGCEVASACGGHRHGMLATRDHGNDHGHDRGHAQGGCGDHDHAPASAPDLDADERDSGDREPDHQSDHEPDHESEPAHCLSCELLAVMVTGGLELPETPVASPIIHDEPPRIVRVRPLTAPAASRARPPPAC